VGFRKPDDGFAEPPCKRKGFVFEPVDAPIVRVFACVVVQIDAGNRSRPGNFGQNMPCQQVFRIAFTLPYAIVVGLTVEFSHSPNGRGHVADKEQHRSRQQTAGSTESLEELLHG